MSLLCLFLEVSGPLSWFTERPLTMSTESMDILQLEWANPGHVQSIHGHCSNFPLIHVPGHRLSGHSTDE